MSKRDIDNRFLDVMREKLQSGRDKGRVGWDRRWKNTVFQGRPTDVLLNCLQTEVIELSIALREGNKEDIRKEAADVANYAMMLADITGSLDTQSSEESQ